MLRSDMLLLMPLLLYASGRCYPHPSLWDYHFPSPQFNTDSWLHFLVEKTPVAHGRLLDQPDSLSILFGEEDVVKQVCRTDSCIVLHVDTIILPTFVVSLHSKTLEEISTVVHGSSPDVIEFPIMVRKASLKTRGTEAPTVVDDEDPNLLTFDPDEFESADDALQLHVIFESGLDTFETDSDDDADSDSDCGDEYEEMQPLQSMLDFRNDDDDDEFEDEEMDDLIRQYDSDTEREAAARPSSESTSTIPTRLLDDLYHYQNRLLRILSKKHSAFKEFSHQFSRAVWLIHRDDLKAVQTVYEKRGMKWSFALRVHAAKLRKRIRRCIPPPDVLVPRLKLLFNAWQDVACAVQPSRGCFFSDEAKKQAAQLLQVAELGLISDPVGARLYYLQGKDRDGLNVYRTIRGTNGIEGGIHTHINRTFAAHRASPELADALLRNTRHRRNTSIGYFNRTGKKFRGHYYTWLYDEIVEYAEDVNSTPSFPIPRILATRITTKESFGIMPISNTLITRYGMRGTSTPPVDGLPTYRGVPVHLLSRLSTAPVNVYSYLAERQKTEYAVTPIHTKAEFSYYTQELGTGKYHVASRGDRREAGTSSVPEQVSRKVNFDKLACAWNDEVHKRNRSANRQENIFYKLPEQLERHHKVWVESRGAKATLAANSSRLGPLANLFSEAQSTTLSIPDALPLPGILARTSRPSGTVPSQKDRKEKQRAEGGSTPGPSMLDASQGAPSQRKRREQAVINALEKRKRDEMEGIEPAPWWSPSSLLISSSLSSLPIVDPVAGSSLAVDSEVLLHPSITIHPSSTATFQSHSDSALAPLPLPPQTAVADSLAPWSIQPASAPPKKKARKKCAACKATSCPKADTCAGSGNAIWCQCGHPIPSTSRSKTIRRPM
ncbi:hypothetical protein BDZ89DRAFT_1179623 [Hymenopellis radicata]|nr:hypothetical protein BDZ89DRAFT_1179623 [Hymenopellis radicata]